MQKGPLLVLIAMAAAVGLTHARPTLPVKQPPQAKSSGNRCNETLFEPNYAAEVGIFESVRWEHFPITIWIDSSTVRDAEEMAELRSGLSAWSTATHGVLGVTFVQREQGAEITVKMVEELDGATGLTRYTVVDGGFVRQASIEVVHPAWLGSQVAQYRVRTVQRDAAHEMGHALGIARHTTKANTIMRPIAAVETPAPLDVNTVKAKYCELF